MSNFFDTLMNVFVFVFVGVMIWLYFKKPEGDRKRPDDDPGRGN